MFIVGFVIFAAYIALTIWSIFYNSRKQQEENYPNLNGMGETIDYDGMGNYGRFPSSAPKKRRLTKSQKRKV